MCYPGGSDFISNAMKRAGKMEGAMGHGFGRSRAVLNLNSIVLQDKGCQKKLDNLVIVSKITVGLSMRCSLF